MVIARRVGGSSERRYLLSDEPFAHGKDRA